MKEVKENISIKCNGIDELIACRKKLIKFGFNDGKKWNDSQLKHSVYYDCPDMCFLLIRKDLNNIEIHTHGGAYAKYIQLNYNEIDSYIF